MAGSVGCNSAVSVRYNSAQNARTEAPHAIMIQNVLTGRYADSESPDYLTYCTR